MEYLWAVEMNIEGFSEGRGFRGVRRCKLYIFELYDHRKIHYRDDHVTRNVFHCATQLLVGLLHAFVEEVFTRGTKGNQLVAVKSRYTGSCKAASKRSFEDARKCFKPLCEDTVM